MPFIEFRQVSKIYSRQSREFFWRFVLEALGSKKSAPYHALRGIGLRIDAGESVGVLGHNGAGKSTLLSLIAGLTVPEEGEVKVEGRISALTELGSGFHPDLTGRENLTIQGALLGMGKREIAESFEQMVDFAELGDFIEEPLRTYSQGMILRLGFSAVAQARPDILLIDELLAVGDQSFQAKCSAFLQSMRQAGKILVCVSHNTKELTKLCERGIWLDHGRLKADGPMGEIVEMYAGKKAIAE